MLVQAVRGKLSSRCLVAGRLKKKGCRVLLSGTPKSYAVVDFDKPGSPLGPEDPRCDYLYVADGKNIVGWVVPLELKKGRFHSGEAVRQLQAGASAAEMFLPKVKSIVFRPVAASGGIPKAERNRLKRRSSLISFQGNMEEIRLMPCGASLAQMLSR